jgi:hypothetical protein
MKTVKLFISTIAYIFSVAIIFIFASCVNIQPTLEGDWVNSDYDGATIDPFVIEYPAKQFFYGLHAKSASGLMGVYVDIYRYHDDTEPVEQAFYTYVTFILTDTQGNKYYKLQDTRLYSGRYTLLMVSEDNNTLEANGREDVYPTSIDPYGSYYAIWHRPED